MDEDQGDVPAQVPVPGKSALVYIAQYVIAGHSFLEPTLPHLRCPYS
jgi:hypothetical protein